MVSYKIGMIYAIEMFLKYVGTLLLIITHFKCSRSIHPMMNFLLKNDPNIIVLNSISFEWC